MGDGNTPYRLASDKPVFPLRIRVGDAEIVLQADGTASGDVDAFCEAVLAMRSMGSNGFALQLWLLAATLRRGAPERLTGV